jgi:hypothetical protein
MTTLNPWQEFVKGLELAEEMERQRPRLVKEYRLYYNTDGTPIGLWETNHPEGDNYVVLADPDIFHRTNSNLLRVIEGELKIIDPSLTKIRQLYKGQSGQPVVKGHAALALESREEYLEIEFYDRKNS